MDKITCPYCKNQEVVKKGFFQTEAHGKQQRYYCKSCNKKFIEKTPFLGSSNELTSPISSINFKEDYII